MKNINKICIGIIAICVVLVVGLCIFLIANHKEEVVSDAIRFKNEYEVFNDYESIREFVKVKVDENNPVIYKTSKEILEVIEKNKAIIFFGDPSINTSRLLIEPLLDVLKEENIEELYYVDVRDIKDDYEFDGTLIPKKIKNGTDGYYNTLKFLDKYLEEYYIQGTDGNLYDTGVKRLLDPTIVTVNSGKVIGFNDKLVKVEDELKISEKEYEDLKIKLGDLIKDFTK